MISKKISDGYAAPIILMFAATIIGGGCDYMFQILVGRQLGPANYSEFNAMLSLFFIMAVPATMIGTFMIKYSSKFRAEGREEEISWLIKRWIPISLIIALVMILVMIILTPEIVRFISLSDTGPLYLLMVAILIVMIAPVGYGTAQGVQRFHFSATYGIVGPTFKLALGATFVIGGYGVAGAMGGVVLGSFFALCVALFAIRDYLKMPSKQVSGEEFKEMMHFIPSVVIAVLCYTVTINIDIFLARQYLSPIDAGLYSVASVLGKVIWFLPSSINIVIYPKIAHAHAKQGNTVEIMRRSLLWASLATGAVALVYVLFPKVILELLYTNAFSGAAPCLGILGVAMAFFGLTNLFMNYGLAINNRIYTLIISIFTVLEVFMIVSYHDDPVTIAMEVLFTGFGIFMTSFLYMELKFRKQRKESAKMNGPVEKTN